MSLSARIESGSALIGVIGLGYVGLPLSLHFIEPGFLVLGFDNDPAKIVAHRGENYLKHLGPTLVAEMQAPGDLK